MCQAIRTTAGHSFYAKGTGGSPAGGQRKVSGWAKEGQRAGKMLGGGFLRPGGMLGRLVGSAGASGRQKGGRMGLCAA